MPHIKNSNPRSKARRAECWARGKENAKKRDAANKERQDANTSAGLEPTIRDGGVHKDSQGYPIKTRSGKLKGLRRDTHAWSEARAKRAEKRKFLHDMTPQEREKWHEAKRRKEGKGVDFAMIEALLASS